MDTTTKLSERVSRLYHVELIVPETTWRSETELSTSYGDWHKPKSDETDVWALIEYTSWSDYSGSLVDKANHKTLTDSFDAASFEDGIDYIDYHGGHGTRALAVRLSSLDADDPDGWLESIVDTLEGLEDYPLADESLHSEMEMESQNEAWESWAKSDFERALLKTLQAHFEAQDNFREWLEYCDVSDFATDAQVSEWFYTLADTSNTYWVNEQGEDMTIDVEDVLKGCSERAHPETKARERAVWNEIYQLAQSACTDALLGGLL
jgi:hypothetical protein